MPVSTQERAEEIIRQHVLWSLGAGLMPVPLFDIAAVTAVQMDMLRGLANLYQRDYSAATGKAFVTALTGGVIARWGASAIKAIPGFGTVVGGLSMSVMSAASTYAIGHVAVEYFESGIDLSNVDLKAAKERYQEHFERGKQYASDLEGKASSENYKLAMEALGVMDKLKERGLVTQEEFDFLKQRLLERL